MAAAGAYLGIRYGTAGRLAAPQAVPDLGDAGRGGRDRVGPAAPQPPSRLEHVMGPGSGLEQSEDCLSLNVWTPGGTGLPILVWLHGGGFSSGSGGEAWYDGGLLARRGRMVVVTLNYRLGAWGYLRLPGGEANLGLLDQTLALRWVRRNIARFGGDPDRVTLAGQSAGALSALAMLRDEACDDLFHQVVLQSLPAGVRPHGAEKAARIADLFLEALGTDVMTASTASMLAAQGEVALRTARPGEITPPFQLVEDFRRTRAPRQVPMLIGTTRDEMRAFLPRAPAEETDRLFRNGSLELAAGMTASYAYRFDWSPTASPLGACHCIELPFVFGGLNAWRDAPMLAGADPADLRRLVDRVQQAWTAFIHGGSPGWHRYGHQAEVHRFL
ncbi:carboxylesterase family protein [Actinomadura mexicana]|uniref:Carboxylic ester hydrolase n=1 Tax=Actinomadura mexicana TaxID=134959 RepID=A0A239B7D7_9ACTN|nr:carboxylesterase family protein [Actinomadura mexicana]SNS03867.1 para-nitrobenzyl esterase [Actinomadura mexicana]